MCALMSKDRHRVEVYTARNLDHRRTLNPSGTGTFSLFKRHNSRTYSAPRSTWNILDWVPLGLDPRLIFPISVLGFSQQLKVES
jgi:hypothetical protein